MIAYMLGLLDDGSDLAPGVPPNAARQLQLALGTTLTVKLRVVTKAGVAVDLTGGTLVLTVRRRVSWPGRWTPAYLAAEAEALGTACPCGGAGCRACSPPRYGESAGTAESSAADITVAGTLVPAEARNRADFAFTASATRYLAPGRYGYDIWFTSASGVRDQVVPLSPFILEPAVGWPP